VSSSGKCDTTVESLFSLTVQIPSSFELEDRLWVLEGLSNLHDLDLSQKTRMTLANRMNGLGYEGILHYICTSDLNIEQQVEEKSMLSWDMIAGQEEAKIALTQAARILQDAPFRHLHTRLHIQPLLGILLHGPPGTGKTLLATVLAKQAGVSFYAVGIPELVHAEVGASEKSLVRAFAAARARQPSILFIDELDALFSSSTNPTDDDGQDQHTTGRKLRDQLITEFDHLRRDPESRVLILGATNHASSLDPALLRYGRFELLIPVLPEPGYAIPARIISTGLAQLDGSLVEDGLNDIEVVEQILHDTLGNRRDLMLSGAEAAQIGMDARRLALSLRSPVTNAILTDAIRHVTM